jgi:hypothetical protein
MLGILGNIGLLLLAFNVAAVCLVLIRAGRRKQLIRATSIDRLMVAHRQGPASSGRAYLRLVSVNVQVAP